MAIIGADASAAWPVDHGQPTPWSRAVDLVVRRRVHISLVVFVALVAQDVLSGVKPHDLANVRDIHSCLGVALVAAGLGLRSWAAGTLHKWAELTTTGPYSVIRHPLYVGSFLMMAGFCTIIDDPQNLWIVGGPILLMYLLAVRREECRLAGRFADEWDAYARRVPRFLPRRLTVGRDGDWSVLQWIGNREYQAVIASLCGLAAIECWRFA